MHLTCHEDLSTESRDRIVTAALEAGLTAQAAGPGAYLLFGDGDTAGLTELPGVTGLVDGTPDLSLAARADRSGTTPVRVGEVSIGTGFTVFAGPCAVEDEAQLIDLAHRVKAAGADMLRGGAYKPRTSPLSFRGLGVRGLEILARAREETGLPVVTEIVDTQDVAVVSEHADMLQIGARNMQNYSLLVAAGRSGLPVFLKRGMGATIEEMIGAAGYVMLEGNPDVVLCERGIRTFNDELRNTLDLAAVPVLRHRSHLPVIADPSHALGRADFVPPMALAAAAAGAHGIMLEVHDEPRRALSDGPQALDPDLLP
ncbi:MAG: 3-deoxy-7-phosphoheptulonate synthase, partial [Planctomycetota bacterium]